jgi:alkylhydroperoxidase family enzyme
MEPIFLRDIERTAKATQAGEQLAAMEAQGLPVPQIRYLFTYKPELTDHLANFTQELLRGPSPLSPGLRELIAAFTSSRNQCPF